MKYIKKTRLNDGWNIAIGLQKVDDLSVSDYLLEIANKNIEGKITIKEAKDLIDDYYRETVSGNRIEEADKVSVRIAHIIIKIIFFYIDSS